MLSIILDYYSQSYASIIHQGLLMSDDLGSWKPTGTKSNNCHWDQDYREPAAERMGMYHGLGSLLLCSQYLPPLSQNDC